jgi:hypothetical protein
MIALPLITLALIALSKLLVEILRWFWDEYL